MKLDEYITTVTEQMRCEKAKPGVAEELRNHILDQAESYEMDGMPKEEALEKAVRDMGDPVETGVSLDRIHRPQMEWGIFGLIGVISLISILLHVVNLRFNVSLQPAGMGYLKNIILYTVYAYLAMLLVYRMDYSILGKYCRQIAVGFLAIIIGGTLLGGVRVNGMLMYIKLPAGFYFSIPMLMLLYIPIFAALCYHYRGQGYFALVKLLLWALIPLEFLLKIPSCSTVLISFMCFVCTLSIAVWKGWYRVAKKPVVFTLWAVVFLMPAALVGYFLWRGADYQVKRVQAFLASDPEYSYITVQLRNFIGSSCLIGRNEASMAQIGERIPGVGGDFIFTLLVSAYGILAGILLILVLLFLVGRIFHISMKQKNQLGMILGMSCGFLLLVEIVLNLAVNLGLIPVVTTMLPFVSSGGSGLVVSYMLLGLVLSVYRYRNILPSKTDLSSRPGTWSLKIGNTAILTIGPHTAEKNEKELRF